jgi:exonuclease VII large subunit
VTKQLKSAEEAGGAAAEKMTERLKAAEAEAERATERVKASVKAAEEASARVPEQLAARLKAAEEASEKAAESMRAHFARNLKSAEEAADRAAVRIKEQMAATIAAAEESFTRLTRQAEANRQAAEQVRQDALQGAEVAGTAVFEGFARAQKQIADFVADRIRQDIETQSELLGCRSLEDVREVQSKFFRRAMEQYSAEARRLMNLGGDVVSRAIPRKER